jgi:hypothetical protein
MFTEMTPGQALGLIRELQDAVAKALTATAEMNPSV